FYFLEMNARLQVEHPVTEWLTGVDLVRWQIRIADGERLPLRQEQVQLRGHAIECRIYAEDPANDFLPAVGRILRLQEPAGPGVRVDSGLRSGDEVTRFYDPMIAKLVVHGENRAAATTRMLRALKDFVILGDLTTNLAFLQDVIAHPVFQAGEATTTFVDEYFADWQMVGGAVPDVVFIAAALTDLLARRAPEPSASLTGDPYSPWQRLTGLRV
ncbi:MAG: acetyl-CoA carboxylase biotin carboxylase subunit, partial [Caldilineae bacterium]